jgi:hypothetical protein
LSCVRNIYFVSETVISKRKIMKDKEICDLCPIQNRNDMKRRRRRRRRRSSRRSRRRSLK